jgi:hypothetical protein
MEATDLEANPEEIESEAEHQEAPKEEAAVETFGALKERYGEQHLAIRHCGQLKKWTQGSDGSQKKLATACRGMTCHAIPAQHKGHCHQGHGRDNAVPRTQEGWTFRKRHWVKPEGSNGIRD